MIDFFFALGLWPVPDPKDPKATDLLPVRGTLRAHTVPAAEVGAGDRVDLADLEPALVLHAAKILLASA